MLIWRFDQGQGSKSLSVSAEPVFGSISGSCWQMSKSTQQDRTNLLFSFFVCFYISLIWRQDRPIRCLQIANHHLPFAFTNPPPLPQHVHTCRWLVRILKLRRFAFQLEIDALRLTVKLKLTCKCSHSALTMTGKTFDCTLFLFSISKKCSLIVSNYVLIDFFF